MYGRDLKIIIRRNNKCVYSLENATPKLLKIRVERTKINSLLRVEDIIEVEASIERIFGIGTERSLRLTRQDFLVGRGIVAIES